MIGGQPVQVVAPALALALPVIDLSHLSDIERETEAVRLASKRHAGRSISRAGP